MSLNDFEENVLNNFISNIALFNSKQDKTEADITRLKKVIKTDSIKLEKKYGINMVLNQAKLNINDNLYKFIFGLDLHTQLVVQGLGDYLNEFRNITLDIENKCLKDEFNNTILKESDYIPLEFIELESTGLYIRANSILTKEIDDKIFTVFIVMSKILFVKVSFKEENKKFKKNKKEE